LVESEDGRIITSHHFDIKMLPSGSMWPTQKMNL